MVCEWLIAIIYVDVDLIIAKMSKVNRIYLKHKLRLKQLCLVMNEIILKKDKSKIS